MRTRLQILALVMISILVHLSLKAADGGRIEYATLKVAQLEGFSEREYAVYLPAGYDADQGKTYPVLYLLHGGFGSFRDWPTAGNLMEIADRMMTGNRIPEMVIICPDGRCRDNTMWLDMEDWNMGGHFFDEFIPYMESHYRIRSDKSGRAIAGLSLGGVGAINFAMDRPDMFAVCAGLSAYLRSVPDIFNDSDIEWIEKTVNAHNPVLRLDAASQSEISEWKTVEWLIDCGDGDFTLQSNIDLDATMNQKIIPHVFMMRKGIHDWKYWTESLPIVLEFVSSTLSH